MVADFWLGVWQGFIAPFVFVASLFMSNLNICEVHKNGAWHNCGYPMSNKANHSIGGE